MQHTAETFVDEGVKLLSLEIDDLYAALGAQLLGQNLPTRVAGIISYLSSLRTASEATDLYRALPSPLSQVGIGIGLRMINDGLMEDGRRYFTGVAADLRSALCKDDIFPSSGNTNAFIGWSGDYACWGCLKNSSRV